MLWEGLCKGDEISTQFFFFSFQDKESYTSWMKKSAGQIEEKTNGYNIMKQRLGHYSQESGLTVQLRGCVYGGNGRKTF